MTNLLTLVNLDADKAAILQSFAMEPIQKNKKCKLTDGVFLKSVQAAWRAPVRRYSVLPPFQP